jgi:hypothetical protein
VLHYGLDDDYIYILELPLYEKGKVQKNPVGAKDTQLVMELT